MAGIVRELRLFDDKVDVGSVPAAESPGLAVDWPAEASERLFIDETFRRPRRGQQLPPAFTLPWYDLIEQQRYARQGHWIPHLLEFSCHPGETLLALGEGLG